MPNDVDQTPAELLRRFAKEERRLLRQEQTAERELLAATERLALAQLRLEKQQARVDRRRARVAAATEELRRRQAARAAGPDGPVTTTLSEPEAAAESAPSLTRDDSPPYASLEQSTPVTSDGAGDGAQPKRGSTRRRSTTSCQPQ